MSDSPKEKPVARLQPGSWTKAEVDAIQGHRVRFHDGHTGTVRAAVALVKDKEIYAYAVDVTPDGGTTILLNKGDAETGDWAFAVLPETVSEEERLALPEWGSQSDPLAALRGHPIVQAVRAAIPAHAVFDEEDLKEAENIVVACALALAGESHPQDIRILLTGLTNGYGDWLDHIEQAIQDAEIEEDARQALNGAFLMAKAFLFDIEERGSLAT